MNILLLVAVVYLISERFVARNKYKSIRDYILFNDSVVNKILFKKNIISESDVIILTNEVISGIEPKVFKNMQKNILKLGIKVPDYMNSIELMEKINNLKNKDLLNVLDSFEIGNRKK